MVPPQRSVAPAVVVYVMFVISCVTSDAEARRDRRAPGRPVRRRGGGIESRAEPFPRQFLAALRRLVPCDDVAFSELDRVRQRVLGGVEDPV
jgi:hypothetical protein